MGAAPGSLRALRGSNRLRVIDSVRHRGGASRVELVRATGLSRSTVSSVVGELLAERVLIEQRDRTAARSAGGAGRPATRLVLNPDVGALLGVHLRHDGVRVALADLSGTVRAESLGALDVDHHTQEALDLVTGQVPELLRSAGFGPDRLLAVGVAVSAPVATAPAGAAPGRRRDVDVAGELGAALRLPVYVGNDANLGAMAEWTYGAGRDTEDLIYVMMADGVGAGLILDGRLYAGAHGVAGELGHVVVRQDGSICRCGGRGCLETVVGIEALTAALRAHHGAELTPDRVLELVAAGDPGARRVVTDAGRALGQALAGICAVLDPRLVVVGGWLAAAGDPLLDGVGEELRRRLPPELADGLTVVGGRLGVRAEVLGAIAMAAREQPTLTFVDVSP